MNVIIYPLEDGGIAVLYPAYQENIEQTANRDVPEGQPYLIIPAGDIPADRAQRAAWQADFSAPDGHGGDA